MKAILLAGGIGSRIWPLSQAVNKHLLPVFDKPMIYYPLTTLMLAGATDVVLISSKTHLFSFKTLLGDGSQWGLRIRYSVQEKPDGIPAAFSLVPADFLNEPVILMLGDNLLYGAGLGESLQERQNLDGALAFGYWVSNPSDYGVIDFNELGRPIKIREKPKDSKSNYAIPGLYFFDKSVYSKVGHLKPSLRGELEITDLLSAYMLESKLHIEILQRGTAWLDTGNARNLLSAGEFVRVIEERQGLKIGSPEEVALRLGMVDKEKFLANLHEMPSGEYRNYLEKLVF